MRELSLNPMRFRTILFLIGASAATVPCLVLGLLQYREVSADILQAEQSRREISVLVSDRLEARLTNASNLLNLTAEYVQSAGVRSSSELNTFLDSVRKNSSDYLNLHIDEKNAKSIAFSPHINLEGESNIGVDHSDRAHWRDRVKNAQTQISGLVRAKGAAVGNIVNLSKPLYENGVFMGLAVCALDLNRLSEKVLAGLPKNVYDIVIFDALGKPIFGSSVAASLPSLEDIATEDYIGVMHPLSWSGWSVGVFSQKLNREAILRDVMIKNVLIWLFTLCGALGLGLAVSFSVARAVEKLTNQMTAGRSRPEDAERIHSPKELVVLQKTYSHMQTRLESTKNELKRLNASLEDKVKEKVQKIKEQEATLVAVFESMSEGFVLFAQSGAPLYVNAAAKELLGNSFDEKALVRRLDDKHKENIFKEVVVGRTFEFRAFRIQEKTVLLTGVFIRDVTSQVQLERLKDELISVVAHELKTPLASARLGAEYILKHTSLEDCRESASDLIEDIEEMKNLIGNWLDSARIDCGAYPFKPELCLLKPLIKKAARAAGLSAQQIDIKLSEESSAAAVDPQAFIRIMVNLFDNAMKYRSTERELKIEITAQREGEEITLFCRDNGQGIDEKESEKIFDRFYQVKMSSTRRAGGVGLGLAIIKQLVELHGGRIKAAGKVGCGTCFALTFPIQPRVFSSERAS